MPHIGRQQVGVGDDCGRGDQVVDRTDAAVAFPVSTGELSGDPGDVRGDLDPKQGRAELLKGNELLTSDSCQ